MYQEPDDFKINVDTKYDFHGKGIIEVCIKLRYHDQPQRQYVFNFEKTLLYNYHNYNDFWRRENYGDGFMLCNELLSFRTIFKNLISRNNELYTFNLKRIIGILKILLVNIRINKIYIDMSECKYLDKYFEIIQYDI